MAAPLRSVFLIPTPVDRTHLTEADPPHGPLVRPRQPLAIPRSSTRGHVHARVVTVCKCLSLAVVPLLSANNGTSVAMATLHPGRAVRLPGPRARVARRQSGSSSSPLTRKSAVAVDASRLPQLEVAAGVRVASKGWDCVKNKMGLRMGEETTQDCALAGPTICPTREPETTTSK